MQSEKRGVKIDPTLGLQGLMTISNNDFSRKIFQVYFNL